MWPDSQDDPQNATDSHGRFLSFRHPGISPEAEDLNSQTVSPNLTLSEANRYMLTHTSASFQRMMATNYSYGFESDAKQLELNDHDHRKVSRCVYISGHLLTPSGRTLWRQGS